MLSNVIVVPIRPTECRKLEPCRALPSICATLMKQFLRQVGLTIVAGIALALTTSGRTLAIPSPRPAARTARPVVSSAASRPVLALQVGHSGSIVQVAYTPDGKTFITGSDDETTRLWDLRTRRIKATLIGGRFALSPNGFLLATGYSGEEIRLWDVRTGQLQGVLNPRSVGVWTVAFSPDGRWLASSGFDGTVHLWNVASRKLVHVLREHKIVATSVTFSPNGAILYSGGADGTGVLWNVHTGQRRARLEPDRWPFFARAVFSPDGKWLATGSGQSDTSGQVRLFHAGTGRLVRVLPGVTAHVESLAFSPDSKALASGGGGYHQRQGNTASDPFAEVRVWDIPTGRLKHQLEGHQDAVRSVAFSPDGRLLATAGDDGTGRLWDLGTGRCSVGLRMPRTLLPIHWQAIVFDPTGEQIATGCDDKVVRVWNTRTGRLETVLQGDPRWATQLALSPDGQQVAMRSTEGILFWNLTTGQVDHTMAVDDPVTLDGFGVNYGTMEFSPDGKRLALGGKESVVHIRDVRTGRIEITLASPDERAILESLAFSHDGKWLAVGRNGFLGGDSQVGNDSVQIWNLHTRTMQTTLRGILALRSIRFSRDGNALVTSRGGGPRDGDTQLWDVKTGKLEATLPAGAAVMGVHFSPDGRSLAVGGWNHEAQVWDLETRQIRRRFIHPGIVYHVSFSADGKQLATLNMNSQVRVWDMESGAPVPVRDREQLRAFSPQIQHPVTAEGAVISVHHPADARVLARLLALPDPQPGPPSGGAVMPEPPPNPTSDAVPERARPAPAKLTQWCAVTPEGYFTGSVDAPRRILWNVGGELYPAERYLRRFRRPELVAKALSGARLPAGPMTMDAVPPHVRFLNKPVSAPASGFLDVVLGVVGRRPVREVQLLVNGRPVAPDEARPIEPGAKPISIGSKAIGIASKPIEPGAKAARSGMGPERRLRFRVSLPQGASQIHLRAVAFDTSDLGSDPVELVLLRRNEHPTPGNLYVLSVGVSRYRHAHGQRLSNLRYPAQDAEAVAARFRREGKPLYEQVEIRQLTDEQATLANVRAELKRLQKSVRPSQLDTVVLFLSGHGLSSGGRYAFAPHDVDLQRLAATTLSAKELRDALGATLRAKAVFLFVDTCHSGGLDGRNEDLTLEVADGGVYVLASSGAQEYSYESETWGHGAFTLALLRTLEDRSLARDGQIYFNALTYAVPEGVATLLQEAGRNPAEQQPRFKAFGPPRVPVVRIQP